MRSVFSHPRGFIYSCKKRFAVSASIAVAIGGRVDRSGCDRGWVIDDDSVQSASGGNVVIRVFSRAGS